MMEYLTDIATEINTHSAVGMGRIGKGKAGWTADGTARGQ